MNTNWICDKHSVWNRQILNSLLPEGLAHCWEYMSYQCKFDLSTWAIVEEIKQTARRIDGPQFIKLSQLISKVSTVSEELFNRLEGTILKKDTKSVTIGIDDILYLAGKDDCKNFNMIKCGDEVTFIGKRTGPRKQVALEVELIDS